MKDSLFTVEIDAVKIRKLCPKDSFLLLNLRNFQDFSEFFLDPGRVTHDQHEKWFAKQLISDNSSFNVIEVREQFAGYIRIEKLFDTKSEIDCYEISIGIHPNFQGKGLASLSLRKLNLQEIVPVPSIFVARINKLNTASINLFKKFNFVESKSKVLESSTQFIELHLILR